jgi:hypothetical protein
LKIHNPKKDLEHLEDTQPYKKTLNTLKIHNPEKDLEHLEDTQP